MTLNKYDVQLITGLIQKQIDHHNHMILGEELYEFGDRSTKRCQMLQNDIKHMKTTMIKIKGNQNDV